MLNVFSLKNIFEYWLKFHLNPLEPNQSLVITCNYQSLNVIDDEDHQSLEHHLGAMYQLTGS